MVDEFEEGDALVQVRAVRVHVPLRLVNVDILFEEFGFVKPDLLDQLGLLEDLDEELDLVGVEDLLVEEAADGKGAVRVEAFALDALLEFWHDSFELPDVNKRVLIGIRGVETALVRTAFRPLLQLEELGEVVPNNLGGRALLVRHLILVV